MCACVMCVRVRSLHYPSPKALAPSAAPINHVHVGEASHPDIPSSDTTDGHTSPVLISATFTVESPLAGAFACWHALDEPQAPGPARPRIVRLLLRAREPPAQ